MYHDARTSQEGVWSHDLKWVNKPYWTIFGVFDYEVQRCNLGGDSMSVSK